MLAIGQKGFVELLQGQCSPVWNSSVLEELRQESRVPWSAAVTLGKRTHLFSPF